jgi:cobalt-precorrin-5B (C1)-methyltransferase
MKTFDLTERAENGLRRGFTTGTCAAAAAKAALLHLLCREAPEQVMVTLPEGENCLPIAIDQIAGEPDGAACAAVIKDGGDDPDQTHRARIFARVRPNSSGAIVFRRGAGVGVVTQPGLQIPVGEPAINPVPRRMIAQALRDVLDEVDSDQDCGFDVEIGCENGAEIARRTFNPRLGIEGGISILGTTGIVEPKSLAAFKASIAIYIRVALGDLPSEIVLAPGNLGQRFARGSLSLPLKCVVQMSNFVGFALECVEATLRERDHRLTRLWVVGHPGKIAKVLDDVWDTHSHTAPSAVGAICRVARELGFDTKNLEGLRTVEGVAEALAAQSPIARTLWNEVEKRVSTAVQTKLTRVDSVAVRLFKMDGGALSL